MKAQASAPPATQPGLAAPADDPVTLADDPVTILLPPIAAIPPLPITLAGLLPNRNHNEDLYRLLEGSGAAPWSASLAGVLAADPFLHVQRLAKRLAAASLRHVINLPSITQYGRDALENMDRLGLGPERERDILRQFAALGFQVSFTLTHAEQIPAALALQPAHIVVAPSFECLADGCIDRAALQALAAAVLRASGDQGGSPARIGILHSTVHPRPARRAHLAAPCTSAVAASAEDADGARPEAVEVRVDLAEGELREGA